MGTICASIAALDQDGRSYRRHAPDESDPPPGGRVKGILDDGFFAQTPLHDWHVDHGGRMVDFAGWSMPVQYKSITENIWRRVAGHAVRRIAHGPISAGWARTPPGSWTGC